MFYVLRPDRFPISGTGVCQSMLRKWIVKRLREVASERERSSCPLRSQEFSDADKGWEESQVQKTREDVFMVTLKDIMAYSKDRESQWTKCCEWKVQMCCFHKIKESSQVGVKRRVSGNKISEP